MRAVVLREPGRAPEVEDVQLAGPQPGELLVRIEAAGVCHSDYHYISGDLTAPLPLVPGPSSSSRARQRRWASARARDTAAWWRRCCSRSEGHTIAPQRVQP